MLLSGGQPAHFPIPSGQGSQNLFSMELMLSASLFLTPLEDQCPVPGALSLPHLFTIHKLWVLISHTPNSGFVSSDPFRH